MGSKTTRLMIDVTHDAKFTADDIATTVDKLVEVGFFDLCDSADDENLAAAVRRKYGDLSQIVISAPMIVTEPLSNRDLALNYVQQLYRENRTVRAAIVRNPIHGIKGDPGDPGAYLIGRYDAANSRWEEGLIVTQGRVERLPCVLLINGVPAASNLPWEEVTRK